MVIRLKWIVAVILAMTAFAIVVFFVANKNLIADAGEMADVQLVTIDQKKLDFSQWQKAGKVAVVNFWATDCSTCKKEMPHMVEMYKEFNSKGLMYVGIAMQYDNLTYIQNYVAAQQLPFHVAWDADGRLAKQFGDILGTPTTFLIDKKGNIVKKYVGEPNWDEFYAAINRALAA